MAGDNVSISKTVLGAFIGALAPVLGAIWYLSATLTRLSDGQQANTQKTAENTMMLGDHEMRIRSLEHSPKQDTLYFKR